LLNQSGGGFGGVLIAAIDGIDLAKKPPTLRKPQARFSRIFADDQFISLVERCHEKLRGTRGIVLSACFH